MNLLKDKNFVLFVVKFLLIFAVCYLGTLAVIGLSEPKDYYSPFIAEHLNYVNGIKRAIIAAVGWILNIFGIETKTEPRFLIRIINKRGVYIAMDCVGYGVYSFWIAYVAANTGRLLKKTIWITGGVLLLWFINVVRITLFLVAINSNRKMPFGIDHHTWFNIVAYFAIFIMMFFFERHSKEKISSTKKITDDTGQY